MRKLLLLFLLMTTLICTGCATVNSVANKVTSQETFSIDLASTPTMYLSNRVVKGNQVIMVHPNQALENPPKVLFVPFGVTQDANQAKTMSDGISRIIWQQFLEAQTFPVLEYAQMQPPYKVELALPLAKNKGADLLIGGYITYFFDGGNTGNTRISLILEVYHVPTGNLLWSIAHAGEMPYEATRDFLVLQVKTAMPFDPTYAVTAALGMDMAKTLKSWAQGPAPQFKSSGSSF